MRKLILLNISCLLLLCSSLSQPVLDWSVSMGGTSWERGLGIALDGSDNIYTIGEFQGTVDFDPGAGVFNLTSAGSRDIYISKLDPSGNFIWAKIMGAGSNDYGRSIAVDASGNVYTTGYFVGTTDLDPGAGTYNLTSSGSQDVFVSKLDAAGNFIWGRSFGGTSNDYGYSIAVDGSGNVYTAGNFRNTVDFDPGTGVSNLTPVGFTDIFVSKLDAAGNFVWAKNMGGTISDLARGIAVDASGNVYTTGYISGTSDMDPGTGIFNLVSAGNFDVFVSKLDAAGNFVWAKNMGGTTGDYGYSIDLDGSGNVYTTGYFQGTADFDPGASVFNLTSAGDYDNFVSKLDASGNFVWAFKTGGPLRDYANSITLDGSYLYIMGDQYSLTVDYDPSVATFNLNNLGSEANFVGKYDLNGNLVCAFLVTPGHNETEADRHIAVDGVGNIYMTARFNDATIDLDPCTGSSGALTFGSYDIYIAKYNMNSCNCTIVLPITLVSFTGECKTGNTVLLQWTTTSEVNNDYFTIEKSLDGSNWNSITTIIGAGNSNSLLNYQFIDDNSFSTKSYYRLKQTDFNGEFQYSEITAVENCNVSTDELNIYPNPVANNLQLNFSSNGETSASILMYDLLGNIVFEKKSTQVIMGKNIITINTEQLPKAMYVLMLEKEGKQYQVKFTK